MSTPNTSQNSASTSLLNDTTDVKTTSVATVNPKAKTLKKSPKTTKKSKKASSPASTSAGNPNTRVKARIYAGGDITEAITALKEGKFKHQIN